MARHTARLSAVDQAKPIMHQSMFCCFPSENPKKTADLLVKGIQETAHQYPWLTGTISRGQEQGYTVISWSDSDHITVEQKFYATGLPSYAQLRVRGMPLHQLTQDLRPSGACGNPRPDLDLPAFAASYTLVDGGVILCLAFHHHLVDGIGIGQILAVIASNTAGRKSPVQHDPQAILHRYEDVQAELGLTKSTPSEDAPRPVTLDGATGHPAVAGKKVQILDLVPRIFTFSVKQLDALRDDFAAQFRVPRPSAVVLLSCLLWVAVSGVRSERQSSVPDPSNPADAGDTTTLILALNSRTSFPQGSFFNSDRFLGNLSGVATVTRPLTVIGRNDTELDDRTIPSGLAHPIQWLVQSITAAQDVNTIRSSYQKVVDTPDARLFGSGAFSLPPNSVMLTSYASFPWYFDFGPGVGTLDIGRFATSRGEGFDGATVLLPRKRELPDGEEAVMEAFVKLNGEDLKSLEAHPWLKPFYAKAPF